MNLNLNRCWPNVNVNCALKQFSFETRAECSYRQSWIAHVLPAIIFQGLQTAKQNSTIHKSKILLWCLSGLLRTAATAARPAEMYVIAIRDNVGHQRHHYRYVAIIITFTIRNTPRRQVIIFMVLIRFSAIYMPSKILSNVYKYQHAKNNLIDVYYFCSK